MIQPNHYNHPIPNSSVQLRPDKAGRLAIWLDSPGRSVNVFNEEMLEGLEAAVQHIETVPLKYKLVLIRSRKAGCFFVGADVHAIAAITNEDRARSIVERGQQLMNRLADLPVPTVAVIDGTCMGGGLELALACRHRVVSDAAGTRLGLPEIKLGLIPGWGGTQRLPKLVGMQQALKMILSGKPIGASDSVRRGLADHLLDHQQFDDQLEQVCSQLADAKPATYRPRRWRDWLLESNVVGHQLILAMARKKVTAEARVYPALHEAIRVIELAGRTGGRSFHEEAEAFTRLLFTDAARSLLGLFVARDRARKPSTWVSQQAARQPDTSMAVIGAGAMGAGIGVLAATRGYQVVFKEINDGAMNAGRQRVELMLEKQRQRGRLSDVEHQLATGRIKYTTNWKGIADCDLAIEAVLEMDVVKREVFEMLDRSLRPDAIICSNTSSLSVTRMAAATRRRGQVAGLHFFNPVDRMELVEVVRTESTDEQTVSRLMTLIRGLGKTPIVTSDKPGFLVNRVLFPYLGEAVRMVSEGYDHELLDRQMERFGMPMGPLTLLDQVGLDIAAHVAESLAAIQSDAERPAAFLQSMVQRGWLGKKAGIGFYRYDDNGRNTNDQLPRQATVPRLGLEFRRDRLTNSQRRMVYPMLNEAVHCLDEAVVAEPWMADLGMVLGTGFAPQYGGPLQLIDLLTAERVMNNMQVLNDAFGERFKPADGLVRCAQRRGSFFKQFQESHWSVADEHVRKPVSAVSTTS